MREITYREAISEALRQAMRRDASIFLAGEDIGIWNGCFGVTAGFYEEFGDRRVKDTPLSEGAIVGVGVGASAVGARPVVEIMESDFTAVAFDVIVNQAAKMHYMFGGRISLPFVLRAVNTGGGNAAAQHSQSFEALYAHIPGLKVVMPGAAYDAKGLLKAAIDDPNPVIFFEHSMLYSQKGDVPEDEYSIPLGVADVKRQGKDATLVAWSYTLPFAMRAAEDLAKQGVDVEVVDPRTISPLDIDAILSSVRKTHRLVIAHEAVKQCGLGAEIAASVAERAIEYLDAPIVRLGAPFAPAPFTPPLVKAYYPDKAAIIKAVKSVVSH
jgi:pyruvate dehydrogenase E1 component beta subunit